MATPTKDTRTPVSFRMPKSELNAIEKYAACHRISKSDALLHYLRKGIDADSVLGSQLNAIQESLEKVLDCVQEPLPLPSIDDISKALTIVAGNYPAIARGFLFGSYARGDATRSSDIDLRLILDEKGRFSLFDLSRLTKELEKSLDKKFDIITVDTVEDVGLRESIEREKVLVYERAEH